MRQVILPEAEFSAIEATIRQDGPASRINVAHAQNENMRSLVGDLVDQVRSRSAIIRASLDGLAVNEPVRNSLAAGFNTSVEGLLQALEIHPVNLTVAEMRGDTLRCLLKTDLANGRNSVEAVGGKEYAVLCALFSLAVRVERLRQEALRKIVEEKESLETRLRGLREQLELATTRIFELETPTTGSAAHRAKSSKLGELEEVRRSKISAERDIKTTEEDVVRKTRSVGKFEEYAPSRKLQESRQITWSYVLDEYVRETTVFLRSRQVEGLDDLNIGNELNSILSCVLDITKEVPAAAEESSHVERSSFPSRHPGLAMTGILALVAAGAGAGLWRVHEGAKRTGVIAADADNPDGGRKMVEVKVHFDEKDAKAIQFTHILSYILYSNPLRVKASLTYSSTGMPQVETELLPHGQLSQLDGLEYLVAGLEPPSGLTKSYAIPGSVPKKHKFVLGGMPFEEGFAKTNGLVPLERFKHLIGVSEPSVHVTYRLGDVRTTRSETKTFHAVMIEIDPELQKALDRPAVTKDSLEENINRLVLENPIKIRVDVDKINNLNFHVEDNPLLNGIPEALYADLHMKSSQGEEEGFGIYIGGFERKDGRTVPVKRQFGGVPPSSMSGFDQRSPMLWVQTNVGKFGILIIPGAVRFIFSAKASALLQKAAADPYGGRTSPVR